MTKQAAFTALCNGHNVQLTMKYWAFEQSVIFLSACFGKLEHKAAFYHQLECEKQDFKECSTFRGGKKSDCKFTLDVKESLI